MSEIILHPTSVNCITCVPNSFIDNFMVEANGEYVKVFLYLLRCLGRGGNGLNITSMADSLDHTQKDIKKALHYWEDQGLIRLEHDNAGEISGIFLQDVDAQGVAAREPAACFSFASTDVHKIPEPVSNIVSIDRIHSAEVDEQVKSTLYMAEKLLGQMSLNDTETVLSWHDTLLLDWSLIEYLIEYCAQKNILSIPYMHKVALSYATDGISSVEEAKVANESHSEIVYTVKNAFGIAGRQLTPPETEFIKRWSGMGFSMEMIAEACNRTILNTHGASFKYADKILTNWHESQIRTLQDLSISDSLHKQEVAKIREERVAAKPRVHKPAANYTERNTDYSQLEQKLLQS